MVLLPDGPGLAICARCVLSSASARALSACRPPRDFRYAACGALCQVQRECDAGGLATLLLAGAQENRTTPGFAERHVGLLLTQACASATSVSVLTFVFATLVSGLMHHTAAMLRTQKKNGLQSMHVHAASWCAHARGAAKMARPLVGGQHSAAQRRPVFGGHWKAQKANSTQPVAGCWQ